MDAFTEGLPGLASEDPPVSYASLVWSLYTWAKFRLRFGGDYLQFSTSAIQELVYEMEEPASSEDDPQPVMQDVFDAANLLDQRWWLPLHHAALAMQHWGLARNVVMGVVRDDQARES